MTLQEEERLSYYTKIADLGDHDNMILVQHKETNQIFVRKDLTVYDKELYLYLMGFPSRYFPRIYECIESGGTLILIEEYIQDQTLDKYLEEKGVLTEKETIPIITDICEGLKLLHDQPIPKIHGNLKPSNIMIGRDGRAMIVGLDSVRNFYEEYENPENTESRRYAAPEQYGYGAAESHADARSDIYSIGVIMNVMMTGFFPGEKFYEGVLGLVIQKCISFNPSERYQTVDELLQDLPGKKKADAENKKEKVRHPHLPPGFRTLTWWKMVLAIFGYFTIVYVCFSLQMTDAEGAYVTGRLLWAYRICMASVAICWIFFWFNYLDVQRFLPLMRKREKTNWNGYILYTLLIAVLGLIVLMILEAIL